MQNGNFRGQNQPPPLNKSPMKSNDMDGMQYSKNHNRGGYMNKNNNFNNKPYPKKSGYASDQSDGYFDT